MDLEGTVEKVQESSPVLVQARDLPGGPRKKENYRKKMAGSSLYGGRQGLQVDIESTKKNGRKVHLYCAGQEPSRGLRVL